MHINRGVTSPINCLYSLYYRTYTWHSTRAPTWPRGLPATWRALCASCAGHIGAATWPQCRVATRVSPARHVTLALEPHQPPRHPAGKTPFAIFLIRNSIYKSNKNRKKCIKLQKFILLKIQLLLISNFLHWITNFFLSIIMPFKIYLERRNQDDL